MITFLGSTQLQLALRDATLRLRRMLDDLGAPGTGTAFPALTPEQMSGLLSELMHAGQTLRSLPQVWDEALSENISEYRKQVERLRALLPAIQQALLRERARLAVEQHQLHLVAQWADSSQQTL